MPAWSLTGLPPKLDSRLYLSYEDLSPQLKQCFLYCSLFPKGETIIQDEIIEMWISEGFIKTDESRNSSREYGLEDIAIEYYQELIKRNLIEPTNEYSQTGYMCTMHDVVRSFAEYMAREESVVMVGQEQATTFVGGMLVRRLSVGETVSMVEWAGLQRHESLITLIINSRVSFRHGDSLDSFSSLRMLYIWSADSDILVPSLTKLKHLRYLHLEDTDISRLPDDIHEMKFLLYISLLNCEKLCYLPDSIIKLVHLRSLKIEGSNAIVVPRVFGGLRNLTLLQEFPIHIEMNVGSSWCSLEELAPLSWLRKLTLNGLEKVHASWMAEKAMISSKGHLSYLELNYSANGYTMGPGEEAEQQQQQSVTEEVLENLCPPTSLENLIVKGGYPGRQLLSWMCAPASADFKSLRYLTLVNLPFCTQLPDGLCCLPSLELLTIDDVPSIKRIGPEFQALSSLVEGPSTATSAPFSKLRQLYLNGLCEWEEWARDSCVEHADVKAAVAMPCMERLQIDICPTARDMLLGLTNSKSRLPLGLTNSKRHALRELWLYEMTKLTYVNSLPSVVELDVFDCPELKSISGLSMLQNIRIIRCPKLEVLEDVQALDSLLLDDITMDTLPGYLRDVNPRYLELKCNKKLYGSFLLQGSSEWNKISHIKKMQHWLPRRLYWFG